MNKSKEQNIEFNSISSDVQVNRDGGRWKSGVIRNFAVLTTDVEATGHDLFVDKEFGDEVADALKSKSGIKSRLTHVRGDGITAGLGRVMFSKVEGGKVFGDLHFWASSHKSPSGNLADFVMTKAEEDPEAFGSSIGFTRDIDREDWSKEKPSVRLSELKFVDIVDSPATNPEGLFNESEDESVSDAISLLTEEGYEVMKINLEGKVQGDLADAEVALEEPTPCEEGKEDCECKEEPSVELESEAVDEVVEVDARQQLMIELKQYTDLFGAEEGNHLFFSGVSMPDAQAQFIEKQNKIITELKNKLDVEMTSSESVGKAGEKANTGFAARINRKNN